MRRISIPNGNSYRRYALRAFRPRNNERLIELDLDRNIDHKNTLGAISIIPGNLQSSNMRSQVLSNKLAVAVRINQHLRHWSNFTNNLSVGINVRSLADNKQTPFGVRECSHIF